MRVIDELLSAVPEKTLFHYTNADGLRGILDSGSIWATSAYHLNDSQEYRYAINLIMEMLNVRLALERGPRNAAYAELLAGMKTLPHTIQTYIASFSEDGDLLSQWLTYPGPINGYAIGVSAHHFSAARASGFVLMRCVYTREAQERLANAIIDAMSEPLVQELAKPDAQPGNYGDTVTAAMRKALLAAAAMKHPGFEREAEWRLVKTFLIGWEGTDEPSFRSGRGGIVPYITAPLKEPHDRLVPTTIHVGPNDDIRSARVALETFLASKGLNVLLSPQVTILESETPYRP